MNPDPYYSRSEVSNSDLTALKYKLYPQLNFVSDKAREKAFHLGTLVDCLVTEPERANHYRHTVDDEQYTAEEWAWGKKMLSGLRKAAKKDRFLDYVLQNAETQRWFANPCQYFEYECFQFTLPTRIKLDWWMENECLSGDLKTTAATTQKQFLDELDFIGWLRSRAWYMDVLHSLNSNWGNKDFIYAISKKNFKVFFVKILRDGNLYNIGKQQYLELAFKMWTLT